MAQVKISSLPAASTLTGGELIPAVQGGGDVVVTPAQIRTFTGGGGTPGGASGQLQYNNASAFGGFTLAGDCSIAVPTITCLKTNGVNLGSAATANTGTSGATIPLLNGANAWSNNQVINGASSLTLDGANGLTRFMFWTTSGVNRWGALADGAAEVGSNTGSDFQFARYSDAGALIDTPLTINRASGLMTLVDGLTVSSGAVTVTGNMTVSNSALILAGSGNLQMNSGKLLIATSPTAPTITGGGATVTTPRGTASVKYTVTGTPSVATMTLAMPSATTGWICDGVDITAGTRLQETTDSATAPVLTNYTAAGIATTFAGGDVLLVKCTGY